jgi:uncharacterized Zn finger protein
MAVYSVEEAPEEVLRGLDNHAPISCTNCGEVYKVELKRVRRIAVNPISVE